MAFELVPPAELGELLAFKDTYPVNPENEPVRRSENKWASMKRDDFAMVVTLWYDNDSTRPHIRVLTPQGLVWTFEGALKRVT